jgi:hypothetical protein
MTLNVVPGLGAGYLYQRRWKAYGSQLEDVDFKETLYSGCPPYAEDLSAMPLESSTQ